jgi:hypothetical protein
VRGAKPMVPHQTPRPEQLKKEHLKAEDRADSWQQGSSTATPTPLKAERKAESARPHQTHREHPEHSRKAEKTSSHIERDGSSLSSASKAVMRPGISSRDNERDKMKGSEKNRDDGKRLPSKERPPAGPSATTAVSAAATSLVKESSGGGKPPMPLRKEPTDENIQSRALKDSASTGASGTSDKALQRSAGSKLTLVTALRSDGGDDIGGIASGPTSASIGSASLPRVPAPVKKRRTLNIAGYQRLDSSSQQQLVSPSNSTATLDLPLAGPEALGMQERMMETGADLAASLVNSGGQEDGTGALPLLSSCTGGMAGESSAAESHAAGSAGGSAVVQTSGSRPTLGSSSGGTAPAAAEAPDAAGGSASLASVPSGLSSKLHPAEASSGTHSPGTLAVDLFTPEGGSGGGGDSSVTMSERLKTFGKLPPKLALKMLNRKAGH